MFVRDYAMLSAVDWVLLPPEAVKVGDFVSNDAGGMPIYRVVALEPGKAWVQGERETDAHPMELGRFVWKAGAARHN